jgi:hypothetical protein
VTLVVAAVTEKGVWLGGDRMAGGFSPTELAGPKIFRLESEDGVPFGIGFAGSPRSAQVWLAVPPPIRVGHSLHWWLTQYCDGVHDRLRDHGLMRDPGDSDPVFAAGHTGAVLGVDGRVFLLDAELGWEEPTRGYVSNGGAWETFNGAFEVLHDQMVDRVAAARAAWPFVQRRHRIGDLADELLIASDEPA